MQDDMSKTSLRPSGRENDDGHQRFISLLSVVLSDLEEEGKTEGRKRDVGARMKEEGGGNPRGRCGAL